MIIQNYANLTLDNVTVIGNEKTTYLLSNNFGDVHLKNGTKLESTNGAVAFDVYYGMSAQYDAGVTVTIDTPDVVVSGPIEFGKANRASQENFVANAHLYIPAGYSLTAPTGYTWKDTDIGMQELIAL